MTTRINAGTENEIDLLEERNERIKEKLQPVVEAFLKEKNDSKKKEVRLGYRFAKQLIFEFDEYPRMSYEDFVALDYLTLQHYYHKYMDLTTYYNRYFEIVDNKQFFQKYMGINGQQYLELENHTDDKIRNLMNDINNDFVGLGWIATESGNSDVKATNSRLRAKGQNGHGVISASEDLALNNEIVRSPEQIERSLRNLLIGVETKKTQ